MLRQGGQTHRYLPSACCRESISIASKSLRGACAEPPFPRYNTATRPSLLPLPHSPLSPRHPSPASSHRSFTDPTLPTLYIPACWWLLLVARDDTCFRLVIAACLTRLNNPEIAKDPRRRVFAHKSPLETLTHNFCELPRSSPAHQPYIYITSPPYGNFNRAPIRRISPPPPPPPQQPLSLRNGPSKPFPLGSSFGIYKFYQQQPRSFLMQRRPYQ